MKTINRIALFLAASAALATAADTTSKPPGVSYTDKKFYFAAWGVPRGSGETQLAGIKRLADAGITDILPENETAAQLTALVDFEEAIHQAHDNGAIGVSFFNLNSLRDAQLAVIKRCNEAYNK